MGEQHEPEVNEEQEDEDVELGLDPDAMIRLPDPGAPAGPDELPPIKPA
jgi:hypothetical protein